MEEKILKELQEIKKVLQDISGILEPKTLNLVANIDVSEIDTNNLIIKYSHLT